MNADTKRHIDAARQVLVGVVPNPASQIDQITNALIYKFMDDMDQSAIKAGGEPSFFVGNLKNYAWTRLMDSKVGNQQRMNLYSEALVKFSEAKQLPELFRGIFKSAYLPYRSPEVLDLFLKEINHFDYSHSEELGNAYEYLLSIMSSQGDAGQFRTPRHIIDFIVEVVNPTKDDKVLDPACGTAGFLISAYKHILSQHDGKNSDGTKNNEKPLTPDQRRTLISNFEGYDIDPGMVRISQVNMYLHQFKNPKIYQYDSLSSDERWGEKFDVILANPPFMSPKGGIKPHSKFSIPSNRSEVLFVDYIMNHLRPKGRAGIIVPEGIIFQSGKSHTQLRKKLVEDGLCAVVSLPSGVFNPYAGVKTSILFFDNELSKQNKEILFIKIENDGFDLGAQRRPIDKSNLPEAVEILNKWKEGKKVKSVLASYVERIKIAENGDYNLSADRYSVAVDYSNAKWPMVKLREVAVIDWGNTDTTKKEYVENGSYMAVSAAGCDGRMNKFEHEVGVTVLSAIGANCGGVFYPTEKFIAIKNTMTFTPNRDNLDPLFLYYVMKENALPRRGGGQPFMTKGDVEKYIIPLPPLEIQKKIVEELDGYQKIISGAQQVVENWKPMIDINPKWEKVKLGDKFTIESGGTPSSTEASYWNGDILWTTLADVPSSIETIRDTKRKITLAGLKNSSAKVLPIGTVLVSSRATIGRVAIAGERLATNQGFKNVIVDENNNPFFIAYYLASKKEEMESLASGGTFKEISKKDFSNLEINLPPLSVQKKIVEKIDKEKKYIESNIDLIDIYIRKTKEVINKLWSK